MAWQYGNWRREATTTAQRDMLLLYIEEVEAMLSDPKSQDIDGHGYTMSDLTALLDRLEEELDTLETQLGLGAPKIFMVRTRGID